MMIIFRGNPTGKCKQYIKRSKSRLMLIVSFIVSIIITLGLILPLSIGFTPYAWILVVLPIYTVLYLSFFDSNLNIMPSEITIETVDDGVISAFYEHKTGRHELVVLISDIEEVHDAGEYYYFKANSSATAHRQIYWFTCQKDLLIEGSIEEFEKVFEGKIVKDSTKND